ncbi:sodium:proton antiporter [Candidatus Poribacteria bacterium]|nr:MAG: sodium:proton antiporter [Candidatus Poribacteria bacterium]
MTNKHLFFPLALLGLIGLILFPTIGFAAAAGGDGHDDHTAHHGVDGAKLPLWSIIPFVGMLLSIAIVPLINFHFWEHHYGKFSLAWIAIFSIPFLIGYKGDGWYEIVHIVLLDYVPFIILLAALFTCAGGICLKGSLRGSPVVNTILIAIGTALASWMGTTGAAMLLIRPILRANEWRKYRVHVVVFFIFLVANIGGSLTPLGDPPLFLGFLKGIDFFWTMALLPAMIPVVIILLIIFFIVDTVLFRKEGTPPDDGEKEPLRLQGVWNFVLIACIIGAILWSKSLADGPFKDHSVAQKMAPQIEAAEEKMNATKAKLETYVKEHENDTTIKFDKSNHAYYELRENHLHARAAVNGLRAQKSHDENRGISIFGVTVPYFNLVRDGLLILIAIISLLYTPMYKTVKDEHGHNLPESSELEANVRAANGFTWAPILEVAKLFIGIFVCMIPALKILQAGIDGSLSTVVLAVQTTTNDPVNAMYFWLTGVLSSFLDNAPTYVVFFNTAGGDLTSLMGPMSQTLLAISCGAVFMGANTYIGNAPNFMVKAIAEENGVRMPSFFGYMIWSVAILVPVFVIVTFVFFV